MDNFTSSNFSLESRVGKSVRDSVDKMIREVFLQGTESLFSKTTSTYADPAFSPKPLTAEGIEEMMKNFEEIEAKIKELYGPPLTAIVITKKWPKGAFQTVYEDKLYVVVNDITWMEWERELKQLAPSYPRNSLLYPVTQICGVPFFEDDELARKLIVNMLQPIADKFNPFLHPIEMQPIWDRLDEEIRSAKERKC